MLRFFQRLGYGFVAHFLFILSYIFTGLLFVFNYVHYLYKWLPANKTGDRIFFFLDDLRLVADDILFDLCAWCVINSARYYWLFNFTSANYNDAERFATDLAIEK